MSASPDVLQLFSLILDSSTKMLELAQQESWDALVEHEQHRRQIVDALRNSLEIQGKPKDQATRAKAEELNQRILAVDARTRELVQQGMAEIDQRLNSVSTSKKLLNTYLAP